MIPQRFAIRHATETDSGVYLALMNGGDFVRKKSHAYFDWFYRNTPQTTFLLLAFGENDKVAGQMGLQFRRVSERFLSATLVDIVVAPSCRGTGVFEELEKHATTAAREAGASLLTSFTNFKGTRALLRIEGWSHAAEIRTLECVNPSRITPTPPPHGGRDRLFFTNSKEYDTWRFLQHPDYQYQSWGAGDHILWSKAFTDPSSSRTMTDLVTVGNGPGTSPELLWSVIEACRTNGASLFTGWGLPGTPDEILLHNLGFTESLQSRSFCVRWLSTEAASQAKGLPWSVSQADTEVF